MSKHTTIVREGHVPATPSQIVALVSSTAGFTSINPHLTQDPNLEIQPSGPDTGAGSAFSFRGKNGKGIQTVSDVTPSSVAYDIDMGGMGRSTQLIRVTSAEGGSLVEWSMTLDAGNNPLLRLFGLVAGKIVGPTIETGINNLAAHDWSNAVVRSPADSTH